MIEWPAIFLGGLTGSAHCVGMCGGIALTVGGRPSGPPNSRGRQVQRQLLYGAGRISTYAFLGAMSGYLGGRAATIDLPLLQVQQVFSILAGVMIVFVGLALVGIRPWVVRSSAVRSCANATSRRLETGVAMLAEAVRAPGALGPFVAGLATGFLPCGLVYAFLAKAGAEGRMTDGALTMAVFGLGTLPAMTAFGCGAGRLVGPMQSKVRLVAAVLVITVGGVTIWRGWPKAEGACCQEASAPATVRAADAPEPGASRVSPDGGADDFPTVTGG